MFPGLFLLKFELNFSEKFQVKSPDNEVKI